MTTTQPRATCLASLHGIDVSYTATFNGVFWISQVRAILHPHLTTHTRVLHHIRWHTEAYYHARLTTLVHLLRPTLHCHTHTTSPTNASCYNTIIFLIRDSRSAPPMCLQPAYISEHSQTLAITYKHEVVVRATCAKRDRAVCCHDMTTRRVISVCESNVGSRTCLTPYNRNSGDCEACMEELTRSRACHATI